MRLEKEKKTLLSRAHVNQLLYDSQTQTKMDQYLQEM